MGRLGVCVFEFAFAVVLGDADWDDTSRTVGVDAVDAAEEAVRRRWASPPLALALVGLFSDVERLIEPFACPAPDAEDSWVFVDIDCRFST